ncbi:hypothetical protein B0H34DRAFT_764399 [Crassisporium funariophilum]|nr:hypothetical protein B0H34DRAFT_764399 [Crassisporium funariophilum]
MSRKNLTGFVLPLIVFPALTALAVKFMFGHLYESGLADKIATRCHPLPNHFPDPTSTSYSLPYTGLTAVDQALCPLVTFFHALMDSPTPLTFLTYFIGIGGPFLLIPNIEASRKGQSRLLALPVIWGLLSQTATIGVTFCVYWLVFILSGGAKRARNSDLRSITQGDAEAIVFGIVVGAVIPSVAMLIMADPYVTALWQPYPVYVSVASYLHLQFRPPSKHSQSGFGTIQALFIGCFVISTSVHLSTIWPLAEKVDALKALVLPSVSVLPPLTDLSVQIFDFLKWDHAFGFLSTAFGTLWLANNVKQLLAIIVWYAAAIPLIGFGAAVTGVAIWRYDMLDNTY